MKKQIGRFVSIFLLFAMLLSAVSCTKEKKNNTPELDDISSAGNDAGDSSASDESTGTARADAKDNLPSDLSFDGQTVKILTMTLFAAYDAYGTREESADIIFDAVYRRNCKVEDRLAVTLDYVDSQSTSWGNYAMEMRNLVQSGDDTYAFYFTMGNSSIQSGNDTLFLDLSDSEYLDFDQSWWWKEAMYDLSLDNSTIRYLVGDICTTHRLMVPCTYFNKALYENQFGEPDELYKLALEGKWTFDKLGEYASAAYQDLNGDGIMSEGDLYGTIIGGWETLKKLEYASDIQNFTRNEKGYIQFDYDSGRATTAVDTLCKLLYETNGVEFRTANTSSALFVNRSMMFYVEAVWEAVNARLRSMEDDYGIIPVPKLDENQDYVTLIHNNSQFIAVPKTCPDRSMAEAVIEALCAESYRTVVEPFFEIALKSKYSRDAYSSQCLDLIQQSARKKIMYEYDGVFHCGTLVATCVGNNSRNFASSLASIREQSTLAIEKYMDEFEKQKAEE